MSESKFWSAINISEGRDLVGLRLLAERLVSSGASLADWSSDPDHHRAVFSLVGTASELERSIDEIFSWADEQIDLSKHRGEHPRLGAVDVVPFVPLSPDASGEEADRLAQSIGKVIAERFRLPVFLYRDSGSLTLPELRRGGPDKLRERLKCGDLKADYGPSTPHSRLGVSVFGARTPLVAFNCLTNSTDLELGKQIAAAIRATNGGIAHLQALAFPLASRGGLVQISMNILNPEQTPPHLAYSAVVQACAERGLAVVGTELIGLVPQKSLEAAFVHFLKLESFHSGQVAEWNLFHQNHHQGED